MPEELKLFRKEHASANGIPEARKPGQAATAIPR